MQNSWACNRVRNRKQDLQLSGQDHHCDQQVPFMYFIQCLWENLQVPLEMQSALHPLHISLQQSYMHPLALCFFAFFFSQWPRFNTESREKHHPIVWQLGEFTDTRAGGIGQAQPPMFICQWRTLPLEQYPWELLPVFVVSKAAVLVFICLQTLCIPNISVRLGFSHDGGGLKVLVCLK